MVNVERETCPDDDIIVLSRLLLLMLLLCGVVGGGGRGSRCGRGVCGGMRVSGNVV